MALWWFGWPLAFANGMLAILAFSGGMSLTGFQSWALILLALLLTANAVIIYLQDKRLEKFPTKP